MIFAIYRLLLNDLVGIFVDQVSFRPRQAIQSKTGDCSLIIHVNTEMMAPTVQVEKQRDRNGGTAARLNIDWMRYENATSLNFPYIANVHAHQRHR
jgi:hypothetical protein